VYSAPDSDPIQEVDMRRILLPAVALVAGSGCLFAQPAVLPTRAEQGFQLSALRSATVAVWPVDDATIDDALLRLVAEKHGTKERFLDSMARTLSDRLIGSGPTSSLGSDRVVAILGGAPETRPLLDARFLAGNGESRFQGASQDRLAAAAEHPALRGIRYAVLPRDLTIATTSTVHGSGGQVSATKGSAASASTGHVWTSTSMHGLIRVTIVDLPSRRVVWEGTIRTGQYSPLLGSLLDLEEDLAARFADEVAGSRSRRRTDPTPCVSSDDCGIRVCISGLCR
jgi:hypothetical protein